MKNTKKDLKPYLLFAFALILILTLAACGSQEEGEPETTASSLEIVRSVMDSQEISEGTGNIVALGEEEFSNYLYNFYNIEEDVVVDGAIWFAGGIDAGEIAVLHLNGESGVSFVKNLLEGYIGIRTGDFVGYMPDEVYKLERAVVISEGSYVALLICEDVNQAQTAFAACFGKDPELQEAANSDGEEGTGSSDGEDPENNGQEDMENRESEEKPGTEDELLSAGLDSAEKDIGREERMSDTDDSGTAEAAAYGNLETDADEAKRTGAYDAGAVLAAWQSGDHSALSEKNKGVLDAAARVISQVVKDGMTDYEKELAIHDWIIAWADYDTETTDHGADAAPDPDNDNPYGLLIGKKAICSGYSSTFQLFMDMVGIECITVSGTSRAGTGEHAWNMVRLDGEWYCVDVTWDDPVSFGLVFSAMQHRYFNVTSQYMREHDHQWDESRVPEATATTYQWKQ